MKKTRIGLLISIIIIDIVLLLLIWKGLPLWLDEINPLVTKTSLMLLSVIVVMSSCSILFYLFWSQHKSSEDPEKESKKILKIALKKQKNLHAMQIRQVVRYLTTTFKLITKNKFGSFRRLPCYLAINGKDAECQRFFEKAGLDILSTTNQYPENTLGDIHQSLGQWHISDQAIILSLDSKQENFWSIQAEAYQWLGILKFLKKFRRFKTLNGVIITLNFTQFVIESESATSECVKELSKLIQMLSNQFNLNVPVYFIFTQTDAIAGFDEFFADLNAEQRNQIWGIGIPAEGLITSQQRLNYFEKEFNKLMTIINTRSFQRLETEKDIDRRAKISCFSEQLALCKPSLKKLMLQTDELFVRGICFVGNATTGKTVNFAMTTTAMRFGLPLHEPQYSDSSHDYFSKKIFPDLILKDIDKVQRNTWFQKIKDITDQFRWAIAIGIVSIGSIGFSVSYARNIQSINVMSQILPQYRQAYMSLLSSNTSLQAPLETLNLLNSIQKLKIYLLGYEPFQINAELNNTFQEVLSTQLMPRVLFQLGHILENNANNPEVLYEALKGYLVFSPIAMEHPEWIKPPIQNYINTNYADSPDIKLEINHYLTKALAYPVDTLPLNQALIEKTREHLRKIPPALFAYHELKSQSEISQDQFRMDQAMKSDFDAVFTYKDTSQSSMPRLFTLEGFLSLHGKETKNLILHTADIYQILGLSNRHDAPGLVTEMNPQVWRFYNQDYINAWNQYLNNIQIENFNNLNQAIQVLNLLTQAHNPLSEILEKTTENTAVIKDSHMTVSREFSRLNAFTGLHGKPGMQYKTLIKNLGALRDYLSNLSTSPNVAQAEFQDASSYLQNKMPGNPIGILKRQAQQLPQPVSQWVNSIADNSFALLLQGSHQVINAAWQNTVIPAYQTDIENRFPFSKQSDTYVNLSSFGNFFGDGGVFSQFFKTYLSPFINTSNASWSEYKVGTYSLEISSAAMTQLEQADRIRTLYFPNNSKIPSVNFSIQPRILDLQSRSVYVQLANQSFIYRHGPQQTFNWHWPAVGDTQQVSISFNDFTEKTSSITLDGPWAWFRLLNSTQFQPTGAPGHYIWTINQNGHQADFDVWTGNNQPVFDLKILQNLNLPPVI